MNIQTGGRYWVLYQGEQVIAEFLGDGEWHVMGYKGVKYTENFEEVDEREVTA